MEKTNGAIDLLNLTAQMGLQNLPNIGKTNGVTGDISFSDALQKTSEVKPIETATNDVAKKSTVVEKTSDNVKNNIKNANDVKRQDDKTISDDEMKDIAKEVEKAVDEIKDKIKSEFSVTDEDIEKAMEVLGLTMTDLFNTTDLRSLMMEITGTNDSIELLTNVELYNGMKDITALADNLLGDIANEFNFTKEQLTEIVNTDSFENVLSEVSEMSEEMPVDLETADDKQIEVTVNVDIKDSEVETVSDETEEITDDKAVKETAAVIDKETEETKPREAKVEVERSEEVRTADPINTNTTTSKNESFENNSGSKKQNSNDSSKGQELNLTQTQTVTTQTVNSVGDVVETVTSYTSYADTENIMRQVTDYVRVNITEDATSMEMQLHPASLGTVNMQISSQGGQITAHLTVQNELVKSVLESQMVKLQETFNEQGTKVTAIEVSVATSNLDSKSGEGYSEQRENSGRRGNGRRAINLNDISSFDELTDEEQLQAEVMEMNGGSVDYTA